MWYSFLSYNATASGSSLETPIQVLFLTFFFPFWHSLSSLGFCCSLCLSHGSSFMPLPPLEILLILHYRIMCVSKRLDWYAQMCLLQWPSVTSQGLSLEREGCPQLCRRGWGVLHAGSLQWAGSKQMGWVFPQWPKEGFHLGGGHFWWLFFPTPPCPVDGGGSALLPLPEATPQFKFLLNCTYPLFIEQFLFV